MILYHCDSNTILQALFKNKSNKQGLAKYNSIWGCLKSLGHKVDLQILDNEVISEYKRVITEEWGPWYQLVPPYMHHRNSDELAILTVKAHFLATLASPCAQFPKCLWDQFLEQTDLTLNLMRQATDDPRKSVW